MKISQTQLKKIREITNIYDLEGLIDIGCPKDEYYTEVNLIINALADSDLRSIITTIFDVYGEQFSVKDFEDEYLNFKSVPLMAAEIKAVLENRTITDVVAALIWYNDKFMICQRPANKARGLLWEFVGGKVENGETKEQALRRECKEELDIDITVGTIFTEVIHEYNDITIHLTLFNCSIKEGTPKLLEHNDLRWITVNEIPHYEFCPADTHILAKLQENI